ncbi:endo-1,4-beta-xylanase [Cellvibrio sp. ARAG 10.3]|uniref:endo-1,4-beta-xylanase n=1 Tax=Cellvibrio sp. ARAG 10.3 TaxID=3451358 RepID=UPI003F47BB8B
MNNNLTEKKSFCHRVISSTQVGLRVLAGLMLLTASIVHADNPIVSHVYTADPAARVFNDRVYVVVTHDQDNQADYGGLIDYYLFSSDDMVNWQDHGIIWNSRTNTSWANLAYAPDFIERNGRYYLYFPDGAGSIGVAVADRPEGPYTDPLGRPLVSRSTPNANVTWLFDPGVFIDDNGQAYLYFGGGGPGNARVIRLNNDMISTSGSAITLDVPNFFEALYMHKRNGTYYLSYSTDTAGGLTIDYMTSNNPTSGFTRRGTVLGQPWENNSNNNHQSIIQYKDQWYIFYHNRAVANAVGHSTFSRSINVDRLYYNADGTMQRVNAGRVGVPQLKNVNAFNINQAEMFDNENGIETERASEGTMNLMMGSGDWVKISGVDFGAGATGMNARVAAAINSGLEIRLGSINNAPIATLQVQNTGGWQTWQTQSVSFSRVTGVHDVYLRSTAGHNLNWYQFTGTTGGSGQLTVELESLRNQSSFSPFLVQSDSAASGGQYIEWPNNNNQLLGTPADNESGQIQIPFTLSQSASVQFQIRAAMLNADDDSFYYKLDNGAWTTQNNTATSGWQNVSVANFENLAAGNHVLRILRREDGTRLDAVTLTASAGTISANNNSSSSSSSNVSSVSSSPSSSAVNSSVASSAASSTPTGGNVSGSIQITNDWGGGYCASLTVTNSSGSAVTWNLGITVEGTVSSLWNGEWSQSGSTLNVSGVAWNSVLQPGQSHSSIGFCANRGSTPPVSSSSVASSAPSSSAPASSAPSSSVSSSVGYEVPANNFAQNGGVESGFSNWGSTAGTASRNTSQRRSGSASAYITGRTAAWNGLTFNVGALTNGNEYDVAVWVRLAAGSPDSVVMLTAKRQDDADTSTYNEYSQVAMATASANGWTLLQGYYTQSGTPFQHFIIESENETISFYADDFSIGGEVEQGGGDHEFFVGNITTSGNVRSDFIQYWDQITPENEGKWGSIEGTRDVYNWAPLDRIYNYARANNIPVKAHTFVWGNQSPTWLNNLSGPEVAAEIEEWIRDYCARYPDTAMIDVVNEATPGHAPATYAQRAYGNNWIIRVFQIARQYCPNSILILNDYNVLSWNTNEFIAMARPAVEAGVVDALGLQAHGLEDWSFNDVSSKLNQVAALGLPIYISEYDVARTNDQQQLQIMQTQFPLFYNHPSVKGITLWGYVVGRTWVNGSGLIQENGTPRPAMTWLMNYLNR